MSVGQMVKAGQLDSVYRPHSSRRGGIETPPRLQHTPKNSIRERVLECRHCACRHFLVVYPRPKPGCITRLSQCRNCGRRVLTREKAY